MKYYLIANRLYAHLNFYLLILKSYFFLIRSLILRDILIKETIKIAHPELILVATARKLLLDRGATGSILLILNIKNIIAIMVIMYVANFISD